MLKYFDLTVAEETKLNAILADIESGKLDSTSLVKRFKADFPNFKSGIAVVFVDLLSDLKDKKSYTQINEYSSL